jgi:hypothetical protein
VERTLASVAPNITYVGGPLCPPDKPCVGTDALREDAELFIADQVQNTVIDTPEVDGSTVKVRVEVRSPDRRGIGVERTLADFAAEVQDGKLVSLRITPDAADPPTAAWTAFQRAQQPADLPEDAANLGGD